MDIAGCLHYNAAMPEPFARPIHATTRLCAVLGHPIRHSAAMFLELLAIPGRVRRHPTPAAKTDERRASA